MPTIRRFLDLSMDHLSIEDDIFLERQRVLAYAAISTPTPTGLFCYVHTGKSEFDLHNIPETIQLIMRFAAKYECAYILFDDDAPIEESLPLYDK
jgi:hypothetical protein